MRRLPPSVAGEPALGLSDDTLAPIGFEPVGTFAITGPPQSGKTTAMRAVIDAVRRHDPDVKLFHLAGRRAALTEHADWMRSATSVEEVKALARELVDVIGDPAVPGRYLIAVENVTQFADSDVDDRHVIHGDAAPHVVLELVRTRRARGDLTLRPA